MNKRSLIALSTFLFVVLVTLFLVSKLQTRELNSSDYIQSRTPTLFFHGYGSSANAEKHMAEAARKAGVTQTIITATVDSHAQVTLKGDMPTMLRMESMHQQLLESCKQGMALKR